MTLQRGWDPWQDLRRLREEMHQLFDSSVPFGFREEAEFPPLSVRRDHDRVIIEALVPGVERSSLDVTASGDKVTLRGERKTDGDVPGPRYLRRERAGGRFARTIKLHERLATDQTAATYRDGLLRVEIPYAPEAKPHKIPVS